MQADEWEKLAKMSDKLPWGLKSDGLAPSSMKNITESKLKAFNVGSMNTKNRMTKKELEEFKKKKEQEETEVAYKDFVDSFANTDKGLSKPWVKGGLAGQKGSSQKKQLYKPKASRLTELSPTTFKSPRQLKQEDSEEEKLKREKLLMKKKQQDKKKSNLELFKEELKEIQAERQERRKIKAEMGITEDPGKVSRFEPPDDLVASGASMGVVDDPYGKGAFNYDLDLQTTNLYLGNINPKVSEQELCKIFGKFGPLASVKVMWPRSDEERQRGRNCGFVAFMNRKDGERALANLQGKEIQTFEMKLGWGKAVPIPPHPVYIPPALAELTLPPPPSGLPFNAQIKASRSRRDDKMGYGNVPPPGSSLSDAKQDKHEKNLASAVVKVVIPTERNMLCLIHRVIEFVVREGPMFEAMIMNRELNNPLYRFLFENQSPAHVYYRWKMFTILQGDSPYKWHVEEFGMFKGGSLWRPPPLNPYTQGMPDTLVGQKVDNMKKGTLSETQRDRLEDMLRELSPEKTKIGDAMVWALEHAEAAEEVVECIAESLSILQTPIPKKIARLFLISDILHNCSAKVPNASFYRKYFEWKLPEVFKDLHDAYEKIDARLKAEQFKQKVMLCFHAWEGWAVYTNEFLIKLQNVFLGLVDYKEEEAKVEATEDVDGAPIEDVDGMPIDDVDGDPLETSVVIEKDNDVDGMILDSNNTDHQLGMTTERQDSTEDDKPKGFKYEPSKWESVDESELEAQAVTTSKWDLLEQQDEQQDEGEEEEDVDGQPLEEEENSQANDLDSIDGTPCDSRDHSPFVRLSESQTQRELSEQKRQRLREIEVKVMKYTDDVEAGRRTRKPEISIADQVHLYRNKLLAKEDDREQDVIKERWRKEDRDSVREWERARERERKREERGRDDRHKDYEGRERSEQRDRSWEHDDRRGRDSDRFHGSEHRERTPQSPEEEAEYSEASDFRIFVSRSASPSPVRMVRPGKSGSPSPPSAYKEGETPSRRKRRSRSRERRKHRSRSPKRTSRSGSTYKRSRSRSVSPVRQRHKHKKSKR